MSLIPEQAPFSQEQKDVLNKLLPTLSAEQAMWLRGYLAANSNGGAPEPSIPKAVAPTASPTPLTIIYGTESGNAEMLADDAKKVAGKRGFKAVVKDMGDIEPASLKGCDNLLVIISTWGEGDPPERAAEFYEAIMKDAGLDLKGTRYSVCGLGDSSYEHFCKMGNDFDSRLEALGAERASSKAECDVDFEDGFTTWLDASLASLAQASETAPEAAPTPPATNAVAKEWSKSNPFPAKVNECLLLNGTGSEKETFHIELSLEGSGLSYKPGDALGVKPKNCPEVVADLLNALNFSGDEEVELENIGKLSLRDALIRELDATVLSKKVMQSYQDIAQNDALAKLLESSKEVKDYGEGREIIDLINDYKASLTPEQFASILRPLPPRLYSIASSLEAHPEEVHLTVGAVRYNTHGRTRKGVASTYLADRATSDDAVSVYLHTNNNFRLPENGDTPIIMVGPGTGIAPFRAFIEERVAKNAHGDSWLFFGEQHFSFDFYYQLEWLDYLKDGALTHLDVAFSRDAPEKVYVQDRMKEHAEELWRWLEKGAHFYVCGDATRMAKDVDNALLDIIVTQGNKDPKIAKKFLKTMQKEKRYQKDVY